MCSLQQAAYRLIDSREHSVFIGRACDAAGGPHLILIGLLIGGPCCALLTGRWALTAAASGLAVALGVVLGVPDQIFATVTQYAFLAAVAAVGVTATVSAAVLQRQRP